MYTSFLFTYIISLPITMKRYGWNLLPWRLIYAGERKVYMLYICMQTIFESVRILFPFWKPRTSPFRHWTSSIDDNIYLYCIWLYQKHLTIYAFQDYSLNFHKVSLTHRFKLFIHTSMIVFYMPLMEKIILRPGNFDQKFRK